MSGSYYDSISSDALLSLDSMEGVYSLPGRREALDGGS